MAFPQPTSRGKRMVDPPSSSALGSWLQHCFAYVLENDVVDMVIIQTPVRVLCFSFFVFLLATFLVTVARADFVEPTS